MAILNPVPKFCQFHIINQEPSSLYGEKKVFPLAKLDRNTSEEGLKKFIAEEEAK